MKTSMRTFVMRLPACQLCSRERINMATAHKTTGTWANLPSMLHSHSRHEKLPPETLQHEPTLMELQAANHKPGFLFLTETLSTSIVQLQRFISILECDNAKRTRKDTKRGKGKHLYSSTQHAPEYNRFAWSKRQAM